MLLQLLVYPAAVAGSSMCSTVVSSCWGWGELGGPWRQWVRGSGMQWTKR